MFKYTANHMRNGRQMATRMAGFLLFLLKIVNSMVLSAKINSFIQAILISPVNASLQKENLNCWHFVSYKLPPGNESVCSTVSGLHMNKKVALTMHTICQSAWLPNHTAQFLNHTVRLGIPKDRIQVTVSDGVFHAKVQKNNNTTWP